MSISVLNTDSDLSAKTIVTAEGDRTITGNLTFSRSPSAPFTVTITSGKVINLDADKLDGQDGTFYQTGTNINAGIVPILFGGTGMTTGQFPCNGRLTLTTVTPVTTGDVTAATTLYFTPFQGCNISLYDGSATWTTLAFTELSIAVPATTSQMYDVWVYNNSGVAALELLAWTNDSSRATALALQNGVLVKSGVTTRRYVGSFRTTTVSGQTEDSFAKRYVWNYYNRCDRSMRNVIETTDSWPYSTKTWRQANGSATNQVGFVYGVAEDRIELTAVGMGTGDSSGTQVLYTGIGIDSTTTLATGCLVGVMSQANGAYTTSMVSKLNTYPAAGFHTGVWLEAGPGTGAATFYGDNGQPTFQQSGIQGTVKG